MNWPLFFAGILAAFTTVGHFVIGSKNFLTPVLETSIEEVPKKVMHCLFHYISAYQVLSSLVLIALGFSSQLRVEAILLAKFIAIQYAAFAVIQIIIALSSKISHGVIKLFQWTFFIVIAVLTWLGL